MISPFRENARPPEMAPTQWPNSLKTFVLWLFLMLLFFVLWKILSA